MTPRQDGKPKKEQGGDVGWWAHPFCYGSCYGGDPNCGTYRVPSIFGSGVEHGVFVDAREGWCIEEQLWAVEKRLA
jgi:hypothetical protein